MAAAWDALTGRQQAGREWQPDESDDRFFAAALPEDYRPNPDIPRNVVPFLDRGSLIALDAALQALASAGLGAGAGDARRFAVADGLGYRAPGQATLFVPYGHLIARTLGVRGPVCSVGGADAAGMVAVATAVRMIARGDADVVIAGAAQALQKPVVEHLRAQGFAGKSAACPFDQRHGGFVAAEGAAYVVVEAEGHALGRGATILGRVAGVGETFDSTVEPLTTSEAAEAGRAMQAALSDAGYIQNQVDLVVSCADGREAVDFAEGYGLKRTFGRHAYYAGVTSVAGALGNALAAGGPLALACALEALRRQQSFPIAGFETPEAELELAYLKEPREEKLDCLLVTCLGLGGTNVDLVATKD